MTSPAKPPPGGDVNKAPMLRAVICSELAVATIVVGMRFFTRLKLIHSPGMDDWIMLATFVCAVVGSSLDLAGMEYGIGRHVYYLDHPSAVYATKLDWLCQAFVITALTIGKVSVAFFILRLSNTRWHFYFLHTINITLLLINVPLIIWTYAQCKPTALLWDLTLPGRCQDPKMQGSFAIFQGYDATSLMIWYTTEMYVIIIAGSLPTLRPLVQKSVRAYKLYKQRSSKGYLSHPNASHELQNYPTKKTIGGTVLQKARRKAEGHSDEDVLASAPAGITKTTDFSLEYAEDEGNKRSERWEDVMSADGSIRADERV
ncbi:MAG: hypothetical protein Q9167_007234 [Letrouitia subvulpina]